jgi:hypothetical protein
MPVYKISAADRDKLHSPPCDRYRFWRGNAQVRQQDGSWTITLSSAGARILRERFSIQTSYHHKVSHDLSAHEKPASP